MSLVFPELFNSSQMFLGFSGPDSSDGERLSTFFSRESFISSAPSRCVDLKTRYISKKRSFVAILKVEDTAKTNLCVEK